MDPMGGVPSVGGTTGEEGDSLRAGRGDTRVDVRPSPVQTRSDGSELLLEDLTGKLFDWPLLFSGAVPQCHEAFLINLDLEVSPLDAYIEIGWLKELLAVSYAVRVPKFSGLVFRAKLVQQKEHLRRLRNRHIVFVGQLRDSAFLPDNVRNSLRTTSNTFLSGYAHRTVLESSPSRTGRPAQPSVMRHLIAYCIGL